MLSILDIPADQLYAIPKVLAAALLSGLIGLEREASSKPAGFRTHMLVGGASALLVILGKAIVGDYSAAGGLQEKLNADPIRVVEAIIVGISFIGAGTILKVEEKDRVYYLTTAASILLSAGVGIAVALTKYYLAISIVLMVLAITYLLAKIESYFSTSSSD